MAMFTADSARLTFIWDIPTRIFHWALVASVGTALYTGFLSPESWLGVHRLAGYVAAALIVFRLVWWRYGTGYSRFNALIAAIRKLPRFLPQLARLRPPHVAGHNPAGSLMILALVATLAGITLTGLIAEGGYEKQGVLAGILTFSTGSAARELHEILAILLLVLIGGHLAGVMVETVLLRMPLVRGMITGWLPLPPSVVDRMPEPAQPGRAMAVIAIVAAALSAVAAGLLSLPARGVPVFEPHQAFQTECSACHMLYHPSLLPRASWAAMMADLANHFGEDASLDAKTASGIAAHLDRYASEAWDTEAANLLRRTSATDPLRIVQSPYWVRKHSGIAVNVFAAAPVKSKSNCAACHQDAASGRFDDQAIAIPPQQKEGT